MDLSIAMAAVFIGYGLIIIGVGLGIGMIAAMSILGMSRQPEMASKLQASTFVFAALIEGVALLALILTMSSGGTILEIITKKMIG